MTKSELSLRPSEEYANRLCQQLEECSHDGINCELCSNETRCRELYDMLPIFINKSIYERYSRGFIGFRMTKEIEDNHTFIDIFSQKSKCKSN